MNTYHLQLNIQAMMQCTTLSLPPPSAFDILNRNRQDPCAHYGPCNRLAGCKCFENKRRCHRACRCPKTCTFRLRDTSVSEIPTMLLGERRYKGCQCRPQPSQRTCCNSDDCRCFRMGHQCDPELCRSCDSRWHLFLFFFFLKLVKVLNPNSMQRWVFDVFSKRFRWVSISRFTVYII